MQNIDWIVAEANVVILQDKLIIVVPVIYHIYIITQLSEKLPFGQERWINIEI